MKKTRRSASSRQANETIGLIGVGLMGAAIAERLLAAGYDVLGHDVDPKQRSALPRLGGESASRSAQVPQRCSRLVLSLPNAEIVTTVLDQIANLLSAGSIVIDTTTNPPEQSEKLGEQLAQLGASYLDATISGSSEQLRRGEAVLMVGGTKSACDQCGDLFRALGRETFYTGPCGSGARMKLASNLVLGLNRAALAEGLAFAEALGLDLRQVLAVLRSSAAYSRIMDSKGEKMIAGDFTPQARLSQHLKDVRLILAAGERAGLNLPLSLAHRQLLETGEALGLGALDNSAIIRAYQSEQKVR